MLQTAKIMVTVIVMQCAAHALGCQDTCKCSSSKANPPVLTAVCTKEPAGPWAVEITRLKMKASIQQVKNTTMQDSINLKELDLSFCNITEIMSGAFANLTTLSLLRLSHNLIKEINPSTFSNLQNLRSLYLDNNNIMIFNIHGSLKSLRNLFMQKNYLTHFPQSASNLKHLDISFNNITSIDTEIMGHISYLDVCMNPLKEIIFTTRPKHMKSLCISGDISRIPANFSNNLSNLQNFSIISYLQVSTLNKSVQDMIFPLHNVITLHIANITLNNVLFLQHMMKLEKLKLQHVSVTDYARNGMVLSKLGCIKTLNLDESPLLASAVMENFQTLLNAKCMEIVSLRNSNISHIPCELCEMKRYFKIDFQDNPLECDCRVADINASLPISLENYILLPKYTTCQSPQKFAGLNLAEYIQSANCSKSAICSTKICRALENLEAGTHTKISSIQYEDDNSIYYIVLGILTGILAIAIIGLTIIYIILRKGRRIEPQQEVQGQSFQELQKATSEDTLLDK